MYICVQCYQCVSKVSRPACPSCGYQMTGRVWIVPGKNEGSELVRAEGDYVKDLVTYMVMDDLSLTPISMISRIAMMNKCNVRDFDALEEKVVEFGIDEGILLLNASLESKAALTHVFLATEGTAKGCQSCNFN